MQGNFYKHFDSTLFSGVLHKDVENGYSLIIDEPTDTPVAKLLGFVHIVLESQSKKQCAYFGISRIKITY